MSIAIDKNSLNDFFSQSKLCLKSFFKLIDQEEYWFCKRVEAVKIGNWKEVELIENTYLTPLNRKIKVLAERMSRL